MDIMTTVLEADAEFKKILKNGSLCPPNAKFTMSDVSHIGILIQSLKSAANDLRDLHSTHKERLQTVMHCSDVPDHPSLRELEVTIGRLSGALRDLCLHLAIRGRDSIWGNYDSLGCVKELVRTYELCKPVGKSSQERGDQSVEEILKQEEEDVQTIRKQTFDSIQKVLKNRLQDVLLDPEGHKELNLVQKLIEKLSWDSWASKFSSILGGSDTHPTATNSIATTGGRDPGPPTWNSFSLEPFRSAGNPSGRPDQSGTSWNSVPFTNQVS